MLSVVQCGGKEIGFASLGQMQLASQFLYTGREVANGKVCLFKVAYQCFQVSFPKVAYALDAESSSWEMGDELLAHKQVAPRMQFRDGVFSGQSITDACLQDGGIRFVEKRP